MSANEKGTMTHLKNPIIYNQTHLKNPISVYTQGRMLRKQPKISRSVFLTFTIYFVSEQGNRFGTKVISLGYLGYLNFQTPIFSSFSNF